MLLDLAKRALGLSDLSLGDDVEGLNTGYAAGQVVAEHTALTLSAIASAVSFLSKSVSAMVLTIYDEGGKPVPYNERARWAKIMPSPWDRATTFRHRTTASLALPGGSFWWILTRKADGYPDIVHCLPPNQVSITDNDGSLSYEITLANGKAHQLAQYTPFLSFGDVLHTKWWDDGTPEGRSILEFGKEVIGLGLALQQSTASYWEGGGLPSGFISPPKVAGGGRTGRKNIETLKKLFEVEQTSRSANHPAFVTVPIEWTAIGLTPQQQQLIEARKFTVEEIARLYQLPPHILAHSDSKTWGSSVYQMNQWAFGMALGPYVNLIEESYNMLLPEWQYAKLDGSFLLKPDRKTRYEAYEIAIRAGFMTRNEARELEDLIALDGLDDPLDPQLMGSAKQEERTDARPANTPV